MKKLICKFIWKLCGISPKCGNTIMDILGEDRYCDVMRCATAHEIYSPKKVMTENDAFLFSESPEMPSTDSDEFFNAVAEYIYKQDAEYRRHGLRFVHGILDYQDKLKHYAIDEPELIRDYIRKEKELEKKLEFLKGEIK